MVWTKSTFYWNQADNDLNVTVSWEDQQRINTFGRLNVRFHELEDEITLLKEEISKISDVNDELYITDDIKYGSASFSQTLDCT